MITFNNFKLSENSPAVNITIPRGSIVYLSQDFPLTKPFHGEILYENFPIHHAKKSFETKILCEINFDCPLNGKASLAKNMKAFAKEFGTKCIWDLPLKYFNIPQEHWQIKASKLDDTTNFIATFGISLLNTRDILHMRNISNKFISSNEEKMLEVINAKVTHGNGIVFYTGENLAFEQEIKIIL
ncbi:MAG: hypothetical protein O3A66_00490 [Proteobacteria bacterium]|jgi:hypothetical protein|nr:hypothetical protein [Pseudomonadota bacterium]